MFTAKEARKTVESYYKNAPSKIRKIIEATIRKRAQNGYSYYLWDYEDEDLTQREKEKILKAFEDAGYTVSDSAFARTATIKW